MLPQFEHEKLRAYQEALGFVNWVGPVIDKLPAKLSAHDQLDRASTSIVLRIAEGIGKESEADRGRSLNLARIAAVECSAGLDVLVARNLLSVEDVAPGKSRLTAIDFLVTGLISRFSAPAGKDAAPFRSELVEKGNG